MTKKTKSNEVVKNYNSVIIEKVKFQYFETSDDGKIAVYFRSGLIYEFLNVKKRFAEAFMNSSDREIGTSFNKYINAYFVVHKIKKTEKFYKTMEKASKVDQQRKEKKARKKHAELV